MSHNVAAAVAEIAKTMEDAGVNYVVYRDHVIGDRLVVVVDGDQQATLLRDRLKQGAAEAIELVVTASAGKSSLPNMLWRAATTESENAARDLVRKK